MSGNEEFGAGPKLTRSWDLDVDRTGDIDISYEIDELNKNIAFITTREIENYVGEPVSIATEKEIEQGCRRVISNYAKIDEIIELEAYRTTDPDTVEIDGRIVSNEGVEYDLVLEV